MKYVYGINTNIKFDHKICSKTRLIILMSRIDSGHYRATLLELSTFREVVIKEHHFIKFQKYKKL